MDAKHELLARLSRLGPMPEDSATTQEQLDEFGDIIDCIKSAAPDPEFIRPLLATFGYGDGFALYTHGVWALMKQDRTALLAAALDTLESSADGPRQWAMETLRGLREGGDPTPPTDREFRLVERALAGPPLLANAAVYWSYWLGGAEGRRMLELASRIAAGDARARAAELLAER